MSLSLSLAIYFIIWWVVLFAVLPWGVKSQQESGDVPPGTDPGAPAMHKVWSKLGWTTVVTTIVFGLFYATIYFRLITADDIIRWVNPPRP